MRGGTQVIDRFWRSLRKHLVGRTSPVGSHALERRIRSCQWEMWYQGKDKWSATGHMLAANRAVLNDHD